MKKLLLCLLILNLVLIGCSNDPDNELKEIPDVIAPELNFNLSGTTESQTNEPVIVSNQIEINIDAKDEGGIAKIEAFLNNEKVGEDNSAPYKIIVDVSSYTSKVISTKKYKNYTLKITATDKAGNTQSQEQIINIDNEKPTITSVSLENGSIINGNENLVTFHVTDNLELSSIKAYLNEELLPEITIDNFELNINTLELEDGENQLKIEAVDSADNIGVYDVVFISDNTGPEISFDSLTENQVIDQTIALNPIISDTYSAIELIEILNGETSLITFQNETDVSFDFDPNLFETGTNSLKFIAADVLGNTSELVIPISIYRRLITLNFPTNYFDPRLARIYVFASDMEGNLLDTQRVFKTSEQITLRTISDFSPNQEFMLTFGHYSTGEFGNSSEFTTLLNLKTSTLNTINLKTYPRFENGSASSTAFQAQGFDTDDNIGMTIEGFGYGGDFNNQQGEIKLQRRRNTTSAINSDFIYLKKTNFTLNERSYYLSDREIPSDFVFTPELFTNESLEKRFYNPIVNGGSNFQSTMYNISGYINDEDFQNNVYHRLDARGYSNIPTDGIPYYFNTIFDKYKYSIRINDYFTERTGELLESYETLDWTIDYSFSNNEIDIIKSGNGHSVGKIYIDENSPVIINNLNISYRWNIVFNSQNTDKIKLPKIPEELQSWGFYEVYDQQYLDVIQVELKRYDNIDSYDEYLTKIIKDNRHSYLVSPVMESKFKSLLEGGYYYYNRAPHFLLD
jgi:hypothetical protein